MAVTTDNREGLLNGTLKRPTPAASSRRRLPGLVALIMALALSRAGAQSFAVDWFSIDGGGGTSTGGVFSVSGTIGQPDAGHMSGGSFTLEGGFWGIIAAIQTPGAPLLSVFLTPTNTVIVAWPAPSSFSLQQNTNPATTNWTGVTNAVTPVGTNNQVMISPPAGNRFYRLKFP